MQVLRLKIVIIPSVFSDHSGVNLKISSSKKTEKIKCMESFFAETKNKVTVLVFYYYNRCLK